MEGNKTTILGVGMTGLVGSRVSELLSRTYNILNFSSDTGVDITNPQTLSFLEENKDDIVLHFAAKTDVDGCEDDKPFGENGAAWKVNVLGTKHVVDACRRSGKKIIYISTDFVFDGTKAAGEYYTEEDIPNPVNWYAQTKLEGERIVKESGLPYAILRLSYPYRTPFEGKKDLVQAIKQRLESGQAVAAVTDHVMCPTYVDDFASAIDTVIRKNATGIFHTVGNQAISPFELAKLIADSYSFSRDLIRPTTRDMFFSGRAPRPFNLSLSNAKIGKLGVTMKTVAEGLTVLRS